MESKKRWKGNVCKRKATVPAQERNRRWEREKVAVSDYNVVVGKVESGAVSMEGRRS